MLLLGNYTVLPILVTNYDKTLCKSYLNLLVSKVLPGLVWSLMASQLRALLSEKFWDIPQDEPGVYVSLHKFYVGWYVNHGIEVLSMGRFVKINITPHEYMGFR